MTGDISHSAGDPFPGAGVSPRPLIRESSPAKINLCLAVEGRRADGFHDIRSLVMSVGLHDTLLFESTPGEPLAVTFDVPGIDEDDNLVANAARLLADHCQTPCEVRISVRKKIPVAAGLGGGSGNAAATLRGCNRLWQTSVSEEELQSMGAELGSDVPLFFHLPCAELAGRGEVVRSVEQSWDGWCVLVHFPHPVSTAQVYKNWSSSDCRSDADVSLAASRHAHDATALMAHCFNDLSASVKRVAPQVSSWDAALQDIGLGTFAMTGAGATFFRFFDDYDVARDAQMRVMAAFAGNDDSQNSDEAVKTWTLPVPVREVV
ncbi:MAG: 4-(cytidine 5'-diphospho)-2-C-methyl-D-erythritol kinase [Phycisphaerae bacterium]